jgi:hypothetical protein
MDALATGADVRLHGRRAALARVLDRGADHGHGDPLPAVAAPHRDARDHPDGHIVDLRGYLRSLDDGVVVPRTQRDETDGLRVPIRHQAG